jgi:hypothetical protein
LDVVKKNALDIVARGRRLRLKRDLAAKCGVPYGRLHRNLSLEQRVWLKSLVREAERKELSTLIGRMRVSEPVSMEILGRMIGRPGTYIAHSPELRALFLDAVAKSNDFISSFPCPRMACPEYGKRYSGRIKLMNRKGRRKGLVSEFILRCGSCRGWFTEKVENADFQSTYHSGIAGGEPPARSK